MEIHFPFTMISDLYWRLVLWCRTKYRKPSSVCIKVKEITVKFCKCRADPEVVWAEINCSLWIRENEIENNMYRTVQKLTFFAHVWSWLHHLSVLWGSLKLEYLNSQGFAQHYLGIIGSRDLFHNLTRYNDRWSNTRICKPHHKVAHCKFSCTYSSRNT